MLNRKIWNYYMKKTVLFLMSATIICGTFQDIYAAEYNASLPITDSQNQPLPPLEGANLGTYQARRRVKFYDRTQPGLTEQDTATSEAQPPLNEEIEALIASQLITADKTFLDRLNLAKKRAQCTRRGEYKPVSFRVQKANTELMKEYPDIKQPTVYDGRKHSELLQHYSSRTVPGSLEERKNKFAAASAVCTRDKNLQEHLLIKKPSGGFSDQLSARRLDSLLVLGRSGKYLKKLERAERTEILMRKKGFLQKELTAIIKYWIEKQEKEGQLELLRQLEEEEGLISFLNRLVEEELLDTCINDYLELDGTAATILEDTDFTDTERMDTDRPM